MTSETKHKIVKIPSTLLFNLDIQSNVEQLFKFGIKDYPNNQWFIEAIYWSDGDYQVSIQTSFGGKYRRYIYRKSEDVYRKTLTRSVSAFGEEVLEDIQLNDTELVI